MYDGLLHNKKFILITFCSQGFAICAKYKYILYLEPGNFYKGKGWKY